MAALPTPVTRGVKRQHCSNGADPSQGHVRAPKVLKVATDFGGMDMLVLARKKLGLKYVHVLSSDIAAHCRALMTHMSKPELLYEDVRARDVSLMPPCHVYIWGAPCQPFSSCGLGQGRSDARGRGNLAVASLRYIKQHKPRLTIMENVRGLPERHPATFAAIVSSLTRYGYQVHHQVLNTRDHGVPQQRARIWLVAIRSDSITRPFEFPSSVPLKYSAEECLLPFTPSTDEQKRLPPKGGKTNRSRELVKLAYTKNLALGIDPSTHLIFTDIDCSLKFNNFTVGYLPCMTATRASSCGWWVSTRGRRITLSELFGFHGVDERDVPWREAGVSATQMGHMLGNTMSLNVCERVLSRALWSAGLVARSPVDRWVPSG